MENATKALLIAASVLIVILLIAFGMRIFNSTAGTGEQVDGVMKTTEITMFNNKFLTYVGQNKSLNDVKALANVVIAHNATASVDRRITINIRSGRATYYAIRPEDISNYISVLKGNTYEILATPNNTTGLVTRINITQIN